VGARCVAQNTNHPSPHLLDAKDRGVLSQLRVHQLLDQLPMFAPAHVNAVPDESLPLVAVEVDTTEIDEHEGELADAAAAIMAAGAIPGAEQYVLFPRAQRTFYKSVLAGERLWKRPPHDHCSRCSDHLEITERVRALQTALLSTSEDPESAFNAGLVLRAGGSTKAWEEVRQKQKLLPDLKKHVEWRNEQRPYLKGREHGAPKTEAQLQLDYGGMQDSEGKKVNVWSATVIVKGQKQVHIDFFFDAATATGNGAKKNGKTGIYFLGEMLDPARSPDGDAPRFSKPCFPT
jgi:hypothetical protein